MKQDLAGIAWAIAVAISITSCVGFREWRVVEVERARAKAEKEASNKAACGDCDLCVTNGGGQ